jgi:hypothetical protein
MPVGDPLLPDLAGAPNVPRFQFVIGALRREPEFLPIALAPHARLNFLSSNTDFLCYGLTEKTGTIDILAGSGSEFDVTEFFKSSELI